MTGWIEFVDAAYPPSSLEGAEGLCFYAGGDTPHVWSVAEINALHAKYLMPIWVQSNPGAASEGTSDGNSFVSVLEGTYNAPKGILVALDSETAVDPAYTAAFVAVLNAASYKVIDYGSQSVVLQTGNPDGYYWGADWTGTAHVDTGDVATQYISLAAYDLDEFGSTLPLWDTSPANPAYPLKNGDVDVTATGPVHTLQTRLNAWATDIKLSPKLTVDGDFGPDTEAAVKLALTYFNYSAANVALGEAPQSLATHLAATPVTPAVKVAVPDVVGRTDLATAESVIKAAGFAVKATGDSAKGNHGKVTAQSPVAGTVLAEGSMVTLTYTVIPPKPALTEHAIKGFLIRVGTGSAVYWWNGTNVWHVPDGDVLEFMHKAGFPAVKSVTEAVFGELGGEIS